MELSDKQKRFVEEYVINPNATDAYKKAGYKVAAGRSAANAASRLLGNVGIRAAIDAAQAKRAVFVELTAAEVIEGLRREAADRSPVGAAAARVKALELLGKHRGMFPDKVHVSGPDGKGAAIIIKEIVVADTDAKKPD